MSKLSPRRYGDRLLHAGDADNPIPVLHQTVSDNLSLLSSAELDALEQFVTARLAAIDAVTVEDDVQP